MRRARERGELKLAAVDTRSHTRDALEQATERGRILVSDCVADCVDRLRSPFEPARSRFVGIDTHEASVEAARANAAEAGVADRVEFRLDDACSYLGRGYDLICFFDCLHDLGNPVGAAGRAYEALAEDGTLMVVEPFAGHSLTDNLGPIGQLYYSGSALLCVPHSRSEAVGLALGAQAGPARLEAVFRDAGFASIRTAYVSPFNIVLEVRR